MKRYYFFILFLLLISIDPVFAADQNLNVQKSESLANGLTISVGQFSEAVPSSIADSWLNRKGEIVFNPRIENEIANPSYCPTNKILCTVLLTQLERRQMAISPQIVTNEEAIKSYLEDLSRRVDRDPEDAKFAVVEGKVTTFSQAQDGIKLDTSKSLNAINQAIKDGNLNQNISLPFDSSKAVSDYGDVNSLGISSLLGEGVSDFKGSPANRVKNIKVAMSHFNGVLIKPGEEFSFVKTLGDVDAEHGYFPELVIKQNVTEPEFGGGICQVSTTAFRAAIYSGLKITARRNHAYPVSYYNPQGMDSTVYIPNPDLRFINNTPGYILIQVKIVGTQLIFDFYGANDGRKTTVDGPNIIEKQPDGSMKTTFTQHVTDKDGNVLINDIFNSSYQSPYKFPHPGGPVLSAKPANWSDDEWKNYQQTIKDMAKAAKAAQGKQ